MKTLSPDHPSHGCGQAWFIFAVRNPSGPGFGRLLLVEAESPEAVIAVELLVAADGTVSETCELMSVHRQCPSIGVRSALAEEVPFAVFMVDMVDPARYSDPDALEGLQAALTPADRQDAIRRLSAVPRATPALPPAPVPAPPAASPILMDAEAALTDLGFKKPQARRMIESVAPRAAGLSLESVLKACLQEASAH